MAPALRVVGGASSRRPMAADPSAGHGAALAAALADANGHVYRLGVVLGHLAHKADLGALLARGRELRLRRDSLEVLIMTGIRGLILEYLETGATPQLMAAISDFQGWLVAVVTAPPED